jgi:hypothetical protein
LSVISSTRLHKASALQLSLTFGVVTTMPGDDGPGVGARRNTGNHRTGRERDILARDLKR